MNFSVLMSLYNAEKVQYLDSCLLSIKNQTLPPNEVVIVFDGPISTELESIVRKWSNTLDIVIVRLEQNVGLGKALNIGLNSCTFDLVARMDTDDICNTERFAKQVQIFIDNTDLTICGTNINEFEGEVTNVISRRCLPLTHSEIVKASIAFNPFNHMTVMYKKVHVQEVGGYQHMPMMEDWYLWLRLLSHGYKGMNLPDFLVDARTGMAMISRRSGMKYIKSEWELAKIKVNLKSCSVTKALIMFFIRSIPRLFPKKCLQVVYKISRKFNE